MKNKFKWMIGGTVILVAVVAAMSLSIKGNLVYFYTPAEAIASAAELSQREIRIGALVKPGSIAKNSDTLDLSFLATDLNGSEFNVHYRGAPPDMFKESQGVVVEGNISPDGKSFTAKNLFVKHSEEYKKPDDHRNMDTEYLKRSMFKNE